MKAAVKVLHQTVAMEAESPVVFLKDLTHLKTLYQEILDLLGGMNAHHIRGVARPDHWHISAPGFILHLFDGSTLDNLCGVRADVLFLSRREWSQDQMDTEVKPFLCGSSRSFQLHRLEQDLKDRGLLTDAECWQPRFTIDDILIDLDTYA